MAEVAELCHHSLEDPADASDSDEEEEEDFPEPLDPDLFVPVFSCDPSSFPSDPDEASDYLDDTSSFALDLFDPHPPPPQDPFPDLTALDEVVGGPPHDPFPDLTALDEVVGGHVVDEGVIDDMASDYFGLGLRPGLGFEGPDEDVGDPNEEIRREGLRVVGLESDTDSNPDGDPIVATTVRTNLDAGGGRARGDLGSLCWDCLRLEDDGRRDPDDDFEWEEVDGRLDEREVLSMMVGADHEEDSHEEDEEEVVVRNIEWEVLLAVNNLGRNPSIELDEAESYLAADHEDFVHPAEYEILFGQFTEYDTSVRGGRPAAKSVIESLPSILLTQDDVTKNNTICAVCKDEISLEERVKRLPCSHHYHGDCIIPWLKIRNVCPVCRYELQTDDPEYESWRARRAGRGGSSGANESQVRYVFESFSDI